VLSHLKHAMNSIIGSLESRSVMRLVHPVGHDGTEAAKEVDNVGSADFVFVHVGEVVEGGDVEEIEEEIAPVHVRLQPRSDCKRG
jgi:hypothetical protein